MSAPEAAGSRVLVAIVMGGVAFALILLLPAPGGGRVGAVGLALLGAAAFAVWAMARAASVRSAWGGGCLANGLLSMAVAVSSGVPDEIWPGRSQYMEELDRAIGPLTHFVWALAARLGLIALILAVVLFALSYWFLGPPHRKA